MTEQGAERAVTISALIVGAIYIYRRLTEGSGQPSGSKIAQLAGKGSPAPVGTFITGWGFSFLIISILASASPSFGGSFAILVAVGDALANTAQVAKDINTKTTPTAGANTVATGIGKGGAGAGRGVSSAGTGAAAGVASIANPTGAAITGAGGGRVGF